MAQKKINNSLNSLNISSLKEFRVIQEVGTQVVFFLCCVAVVDGNLSLRQH